MKRKGMCSLSRGMTLAVGFGLLGLSSCTLADVRHNVISGALGFVEGYTEDLLAALITPPEDLVGEGEGE